MFCLPLRKDDPDTDTENLIAYATANLNPDFLACWDRTELQTRLETFLPGRWIDDIVLRKLSQTTCAGHDYYVAETLSLDISNPDDSVVDQSKGTVITFFVNEHDQSSLSAPKNH